jgi:hypothetical protein
LIGFQYKRTSINAAIIKAAADELSWKVAEDTSRQK